MKEIKLTQGKIALVLVDDDDHERISKHKWCYDGQKYANRSEREGGKKIKIYMHCEILKPPDGLETDHINLNKLDNQKSNLRICTNSQQQQNCPIRKDNTSGFKGVSWNKKIRKWEAYISCNRIRTRLGFHNSLEEAARAYDDAAFKLFGEFARLNFGESQ
jgi:hypothetical protein